MIQTISLHLAWVLIVKFKRIALFLFLTKYKLMGKFYILKKNWNSWFGIPNHPFLWVGGGWRRVWDFMIPNDIPQRWFEISHRMSKCNKINFSYDYSINITFLFAIIITLLIAINSQTSRWINSKLLAKLFIIEEKKTTKNWISNIWCGVVVEDVA